MEHYKKKIVFFKDFSNFKKFLKVLQESLQFFLGPIEKNCLFFQQKEISFLTNGLDFLKNLEFISKEKRLFIKLLEQASLKTYSISSNGTTLTAFFCSSLFFNALKFLAVGYNPIFLSNGLIKIASFSVERLSNYSVEITKISQLKNLLTTFPLSQKYNDFKNLLLAGVTKFSKDTIILVEENDVSKNKIEFSQGIEVEKGFLSSYFINDFTNFQVVYKNPYILVSNFSIDSIEQLKDVISFCQSKNRALVIVTEEIEKSTLSKLILMNLKKQLKVAVIKYNSIKFLNNEILNDLSILVHSGLTIKKNKFSLKDLGNAEKVIIKKTKSFFIISKFSKLIAIQKIKELTKKLLAAETNHEKENFKLRIARLSGNILKLKVKKISSNSYDTTFLKKKLEQFLETLKSSLEEGIIPGGNSFYFLYSKEVANWSEVNLLGDEIIASKMVCKVLTRLGDHFNSFGEKKKKLGII